MYTSYMRHFFFAELASSARIILSYTRVLILLALLLPLSLSGQAQYVEDGLRYSLSNGLYNVRQAAFGVAYNGIADDYAATYTNPAGLTLLPVAEFTAGVQYLVNNNTSTFLGNTFVRNSATFAPTHIGLVLPVRLGQSGNFSFSFGYSRESDFTRHDSVSGFNTESTLIASWVDGQNSPDLRNNFAWRMFLADTVRGRFLTPLRNNLQQNIGMRESGEMNTFSVGFGIDLTEHLAAGVSLIGSFGTYRYFRRIQEIDLENRYNRLDAQNFSNVDFFRMSYAELLLQEVSGLKFIVGAQGRIGDNIRIGASATLPLQYQVAEDFSRSGITRFDKEGDSVAFNPNDPPTLRYIIATPITVSAGASAHFSGLTLTAGGEYIHIQGMSFSGSSDFNASEVNAVSRQLLGTHIRLGVGGEYEFANEPYIVRGSVSYASSPYQEGRADGGSQVLAAVGAGYYLGINSRLDIAYRVIQQTMTNQVYAGLNFRSLQFIHTCALQYSVRF